MKSLKKGWCFANLFFVAPTSGRRTHKSCLPLTMATKTISILGCGWLGLPLGKHLANNGYLVKGTTTSETKIPLLQEAGIESHLLRFTPQPDGEFAPLLATDVLIICIPPRAGQFGDAFHPQQIEAIAKALLPSTAAIIYISSTSVYPENNQEITENDGVIHNLPLITAENSLKNVDIPLTILRCGGLMGYDRIPGKYFIGKTVTTGEIPVNFVHRDDVIGIIEQVINQSCWGETFNVVAPEHPVRRDIYLKNAEQFGWQAPTFVDGAEPIPFKIINADKLTKKLGYRFQYPNPLNFLYSAI